MADIGVGALVALLFMFQRLDQVPCCNFATNARLPPLKLPFLCFTDFNLNAMLALPTRLFPCASRVNVAVAPLTLRFSTVPEDVKGEGTPGSTPLIETASWPSALKLTLP